jgi:hypothetical protein
LPPATARADDDAIEALEAEPDDGDGFADATDPIGGPPVGADDITLRPPTIAVGTNGAGAPAGSFVRVAALDAGVMDDEDPADAIPWARIAGTLTPRATPEVPRATPAPSRRTNRPAPSRLLLPVPWFLAGTGAVACAAAVGCALIAGAIAWDVAGGPPVPPVPVVAARPEPSPAKPPVPPEEPPAMAVTPVVDEVAPPPEAPVAPPSPQARKPRKTAAAAPVAAETAPEPPPPVAVAPPPPEAPPPPADDGDKKKKGLFGRKR